MHTILAKGTIVLSTLFFKKKSVYPPPPYEFKGRTKKRVFVLGRVLAIGQPKVLSTPQKVRERKNLTLF